MKRILVVDDETSMRQLLEITLRKEGYRVTTARSGRRAVEAFEKASYDLVISDIRMPDMSGVDVLRHVKGVAPETPVIMVTAYSSAETAVDVRVIAATNQNLEEMMEEKAFREDLYYRLNVIPVHMVPLRERRDDIPMLAEHFLLKANKSMNKQVAKISDEAMDLLTKGDWPGNVRELENVIERAVAMETSRIILPERLPEKLQQGNGDMVAALGGPSLEELPEEGIDFQEHMDSIQKHLLSLALARAGGVQTRAAKFLRMNLRSFRYLLQKYDLR